MPASSAAALLLLSFVPGLLYLRLTEDYRRLRPESQIAQLVEFAAIGLATTGITTAALGLLKPSWTADLLNDLATSPLMSDEVQRSAIGVGVIGVGSCTLSYLFASSHRLFAANLYSPSVWFSTLRERRSGAIWVAAWMKDGRKIAGALAGSDSQKEPGSRDVAISDPVVISRDGTHSRRDVDLIVINESELEVLEILHSGPGALPHPEPAAAKSRSGLPAIAALGGYAVGLLIGATRLSEATSRTLLVAGGSLLLWKALTEMVDSITLEADWSKLSWDQIQRFMTPALSGGAVGTAMVTVIPTSSPVLGILAGACALLGIALVLRLYWMLILKPRSSSADT